jgi:glycosyltransferase involved in cell wall biosynthesis
LKLSVVIPVYNEEGTIKEVIRRVSEVDIPKEIIVVDDGSTDGTAAEIESVMELFGARLLRNPVNRGKGAAVRLGFENASGDAVIIQDADLELDPGEYVTLMKPMERENAPVVYGSRFSGGTRHDWSLSYLANRFLTGLTNLLYGTGITDMETCYKLLRKDVLEAIRLEASRFDIEPEITAKVARAGFRIYEVPVSYRPRTAREGKKIGWRDGLRAVRALLKYRFLPKDRCVRR